MKPRLATLQTAWCLLVAAVVAPAYAQIPASTGPALVSSRDLTLPNAILPIWSISVEGLWDTQCPPVLQSVALDGNDLRIDARSVLALCPRQPTPYSVELNPALALRRATLAPGVYRVSFYAADGAQVQPQLHAFALIDRSAPDAGTTAPETGFWSSDGDDRTLLSLELQGSQLSAALLSYDADGQPAWFFGSAPYDGRIAHVPMLRLSGGNAPFAPALSSPHGDAAMTLDLQFSASAHAHAWLSRMRNDGSLQLRALEISRLPLAASVDGSAWQGDWVLVTDAVNAVPQRLQLNDYQALDAQHFQLASADGAVALSCTRAVQAQSPTPRSCSLHLSDGSISHFDSVAIGRMDGKAANGAAVHLLRITP